MDGTNKIASQFDALAKVDRVRFTAPDDAVKDWIPDGFVLVANPEHVLTANDCIRHILSSDWRLVSNVNGGSRIGLRAVDAGEGVIYVATPK